MKSYKLKPLLIAACCAVTALWTEIQGMEERRDNPAGGIISFAGEIAPDGWLLCDGREWSSGQYPELYKAIQLKFVPDHEELRVLRHNAAADNVDKLFYVPDLRGRVIVGIDGGTGRVTANNILGASGGKEDHKLINAEMPIGNNPITVGNRFDGVNGTGQYGVVGLSQLGGTQDYPNTGGDQPHNNMPPYTCLNYIINTGQANGAQQNEIVQLKERIERLEVSLEDLKKATPAQRNTR
jgi:microcystin-dependent protein